uniref:TonB-dependent receptor n=1 Tax=Polymorphobacter sp. TaxID=1909290 RepID=UPI003F72AA2E
MMSFFDNRQVSVSALAVALLCAPAMATAQTTAATSTATAAEDSNEIVVTGLKRETALVDTPVSISVYNSETIEKAGILKVGDFLQLTPNVDFVTSVNAGDFLINVRGQASIRNAEPSVAIIVDGVRIGSPAEFNSALFDLEQIEVLKGPQGTLFGRNASAGAIIITTKKPTEDLTVNGMFSYGKFSTYNANASISGAIMPGLTARLSGAFTGTDGTYTNVNTDEKPQRFKEEVGRLRLVWDNGGPFTADGRIVFSHATGGAVAYTPKIQAVPGLSPNGTLVGGVRVTDISANENLDVPFVTDVPGRYEREIISTGLVMEYDFGAAVLTSVTGFSDVLQYSSGKNYPYSNPSDPSTNYFGWTPIFGDRTQNLRIKTTQFSQELRLTSKDEGFLNWQVGFEFVWNRRDYRVGNTLNGALPAGITAAELVGYVGYNAAGVRTLVGGGNAIPFPIQIYGLDTPYATGNLVEDRFDGTNYAPFANVTLNFSEQLSLELAGRYDI